MIKKSAGKAGRVSKIQMISMTILVVFLIAALILANHLASKRASETGSNIAGPVFAAHDALHGMHYGASRMISSMNELLVLHAVHSAANNTGESNMQEENELIERGQQQFLITYNSFVENYKALIPENGNDRYAPLIEETEQQYRILLRWAENIREISTTPFNPETVSELKEMIEKQEMLLLAAIEAMSDMADNDIAELIYRQESFIQEMDWLAGLLASTAVIVIIFYLIYVLRILNNERDALATTENTLAELEIATIAKELAMEKRLELEKSLAHRHKLEALGTLAGGVSHEINNQLTPILTMAERIRDRMAPDHPDLRKIELVLRGAENARRTVSKILAFARTSNDQFDVCGFESTFHATIEAISAACPSRIKLHIETGDMQGILNIHADDLQGAIVNLFSNAVDAYDGLSGDIYLTAGKHHADQSDEMVILPEGNYACISIRDNGPGMDEETRQRIFDPFYTTKDPGKGVGLGMSIVHTSISKAGGVVKLDSEPGKGSCFTLYLPLVAATDAATLSKE